MVEQIGVTRIIIQNDILEILGKSQEGESDPRTVFKEIRERYEESDDILIREAVWQLIAQGDMELTPKRKFKKPTSSSKR